MTSTPNWDSIQNEVVSILQGLLRLDTTNPPGNEILCAEYIADLLRQDGV